jgi:hypothetical protein
MATPFPYNIVREGHFVAKPVTEVIHRGDFRNPQERHQIWQTLDRKSEHLLEGEQRLRDTTRDILKLSRSCHEFLKVLPASKRIRTGVGKLMANSVRGRN